jgi:ATP-dependent Clp protease ATP-binding subunit ClpA
MQRELFHTAGQPLKERFESEAWGAFDRAADSARIGGWESIRTPHLFVGLLRGEDAVIHRWANFVPIDGPQLANEIERLFRCELPGRPGTLPVHREFFSNGLLAVLQQAAHRASQRGCPFIAPSDLLHALLSHRDSIVSETLETAGICPAEWISLLENAEMPAPPSSELAHPFQS